MRLTNDEIATLKNWSEEAKGRVNNEGKYHDEINAVMHAYRAEFTSSMINAELNTVNGKYDIQSEDEEMVEEGYEELEDAKTEARTSTLFYKSKLIGLYKNVNDRISARGRFDWLFHPVRTYRENKAMEYINEEFKSLHMSKDEIDGLSDLLDPATPVPEYADYTKNGISISIDHAVSEPQRMEIDLGEEQNMEVDRFKQNDKALENTLDL